MLEARKASYLKVIAATMKPPARPDKPAESIQPVQPAQPVQTSQLEQQAKPVQPVQPVVQANQQARSTLTTASHTSSQAEKFHPPHNSLLITNGVTNSHSSVSKYINYLYIIHFYMFYSNC